MNEDRIGISLEKSLEIEAFGTADNHSTMDVAATARPAISVAASVLSARYTSSREWSDSIKLNHENTLMTGQETLALLSPGAPITSESQTELTSYRPIKLLVICIW